MFGCFKEMEDGKEGLRV